MPPFLKITPAWIQDLLHSSLKYVKYYNTPKQNIIKALFSILQNISDHENHI